LKRNGTRTVISNSYIDMPTSVSKYLPRHNGTTKIIDFTERPVCKHCKKPMKIVKTSIIDPIVGLLENYDVSRVNFLKSLITLKY